MVYRMVSAQPTNLFCELAEHFLKDASFHSGVDMLYNEPCRNMKLPMVAQSPYNIVGIILCPISLPYTKWQRHLHAMASD